MTEEYIRPDGRNQKDLRDINIEVGILDRAEGSARVYLGKNIAIATVYGPREMHPKHAALPDRAQMRINYRMATFSVDGYKRSYPSRREKEISKVLSEAFESVVMLKNWPRSVVDVHVQLLQSDGGTRTAAAIAISAALADAGLPMRDLPAGIATGLYEDKVCLDLTGHEDMKGSGDMPVMYSPSVDEISLFQLDGQFTFDQFKESFETSKDAISRISEMIRNAVKEKYLLVRDQYIDDEEEEIDEALLDDDDDDDEEEIEDEDEEITPVPEEPIGEAHTVAVSGTSAEEPGAEAITTEAGTEGTREETVIPSAPIPDDLTEEDQSKVSPASETDPSDIDSLSAEGVSNRWFTKTGGEITTTTSDDDDSSEEDEDEEDDEEEETSGIMRDLEYSFDEEE